jgi:hypothetical protein
VRETVQEIARNDDVHPNFASCLTKRLVATIMPHG